MRLFSSLVAAGVCAAVFGCGGDDGQTAGEGTGDAGTGGSAGVGIALGAGNLKMLSI